MNIQTFQNASLYTAITTHFNSDGTLDYKAAKKHAQFLIDGGVEGFIIAGTTGEGHLLSWDEHFELFQFYVDHFKGQVLLIGNVGSNSTKESKEAARKAFEIGVDAILIINPYYGKTSERGIIQHLEAAMQYGPSMIYNVSSRTAQDIKPHIIKTLSSSDHFIGVKECEGNERIELYEQQGIACWSGNDDQCHEGVYKNNSHGVVSVAANIVPSLMKTLMEKKDHDQLNKLLGDLFRILFLQPNPIAIKTILMMMEFSQPVFRLPYVPFDHSLREEAIKIIKQLNLTGLSDSIHNIADQDFILL